MCGGLGTIVNKIMHGFCQGVIQCSKGKQTTSKEFKPCEEPDAMIGDNFYFVF